MDTGKMETEPIFNLDKNGKMSAEPPEKKEVTIKTPIGEVKLTGRALAQEKLFKSGFNLLTAMMGSQLMLLIVIVIITAMYIGSNVFGGSGGSRLIFNLSSSGIDVKVKERPTPMPPPIPPVPVPVPVKVKGKGKVATVAQSTPRPVAQPTPQSRYSQPTAYPIAKPNGWGSSIGHLILLILALRCIYLRMTNTGNALDEYMTNSVGR